MRLFVGLELPGAVRGRLDEMDSNLPGARWIDAESLHLTLRFIGEVGRIEAEEVDEALAALRGRGFELVLTGVGVFARGGRPVTLWAGVERNPALEHLQAKVETALQRCGLPPERRRFVPHVSLARLSDTPEERIARWLAAHNLFRAEAFAVRHFTLFSSILGKEQAHYTPEVEYALA